MPGEERRDEELLKAALTPTGPCPAIEELERALDGTDVTVAGHVESCARCRAELELLASFRDGAVNPQDAEAVLRVTARLHERSAEIFEAAEPGAGRRGRVIEMPVASGERRKKSRFRLGWMGVAAVLALVAVGLEVRKGPPRIYFEGEGQPETTRAAALSILGPAGDLSARPEQVRWQAVARATSYRVRMLAVDHSELWSGETSQTVIILPAVARAQIVPAKTLLLEVTALNDAGSAIAVSEPTAFKLLPSFYGR